MNWISPAVISVLQHNHDVLSCVCTCKHVVSFIEDWKSQLCNLNRSRTLFHFPTSRSHSSVCLYPPLPLSFFPLRLPSFTPPAHGKADLQITILSVRRTHVRVDARFRADTRTPPVVRRHAGRPRASSSCEAGFGVCCSSYGLTRLTVCPEST